MTRIAMAITRDRNRTLLSSLFTDQEIVEIDERVPQGTDLCLIDEGGFTRVVDALDTWRTEEHPTFTPVLLLTESTTADPWAEYAEHLTERIDAIMQIPAQKKAITNRVETLLRMRTFSQRLSAEHQLNERIFDTSPLAMTVLDTDGTIVRVNDRAEDLLGLSPSDLQARPYDAPDWRIFDEHDEPIPSEELPFARVMATGEPVHGYEHGIERADGEEVWLSINMAPIRDEAGEIEYVVGALEDITVQRARELELRQMTRAVDTAPIGITLTDPTRDDNPLVYVNEGFLDLTGYDREDVIGRNCRFLQGEGTDPETVARIRQAIDAAEPVSVVLRNYRADGTEFWNRLEIAPVYDEDGQLINFIGFQQDVTEGTDRQQQLQTLDRYLRHNLRNKLNVVIGLAEQIQLDGEPPLTEYADTVEDTSRVLLGNMAKARAITNLLRAEPEVGPVDVRSVLGRVVEKLRGEYPAATISVAGPDSVTAQAIPQLFVALEELIRNAIEHTDESNPTVEIEVTAEEAVTIQVADQGPGIPSMEVDILSGTTEETPISHGQGLGLWLVSLIVRRCGGQLEFEANEPQGTVVTVVLPA